MLNLDTRIPLMAQERDYGRGFDTMQQAQMNNLKLQALRDEYNAAKEEKLRQKQMRQGMASELQKLQQGTPDQYNTTFPQTMPTGQMPSGMTGVLANERGQNMPQPKAFGENILQGNVDFNREMVSPAVAPKQPDIKDVLTAQFNAAMAVQDVETAFDAAKKLKELEKNPNKYFGGLTKGVDPKTNKPLFLAMTESGVVPVDGYQPYEEPMSAKEVKANDLAERKFKAEQAQKQKEYDLDYKKYIADLNKPAPIDPIEKAGAIADIKADAAVRKDLIGDAANVVKTYNIMSPMINSAISIVKKLPPDMLQSKYQSMLAGTPLNKYLGNPEQQQAITDYNLMLENLRLYIEKPAGAISNYEQGILGRAIGILEGNYSNEQKESALKQVKGIFDNQKNVAENVLKQNKADKFIYNKDGKPLRFTKNANSQQRREYGEAVFAAKGDSELIREIQEHARELGVLE
jgi:hypothetical protein